MQLEFQDKDEALNEAKIQSKKESYIVVIESKGRYYVENRQVTIRSFENTMIEYVGGKPINIKEE